MARRGQFGRLPRAVPSLTNTVVAVAREMQNQRDQNLMDAWQKGGNFEGMPATDQAVLAHWKDRLVGISKDDPMYNTYESAYTQTDYAIHESKASTAYSLIVEPTPADDTRMAQFYLGWSKKIPKDSEFYRVLQRDGAQFLRSAKSKADAGKAKRDAAAYAAKVKSMHDKDQASGELLLSTFQNMASRGNADAGITALIGGPGSGQGLDNFNADDPEQMMHLMNLLNGTANVGGEHSAQQFGNTVLYHDDLNRPVTNGDVLAKLKALDPKFVGGSGGIDRSYVNSQLVRMEHSIEDVAAYQTKTGHYADAANSNDRLAQVAMVTRQFNAYPIEQSYMIARGKYQEVASNVLSAPATIMAAWEKYQGVLTRLADDPSISADDNTRARLMAEVNQTTGAPTLYESFTGLVNGTNPDNISTTDIATNKLTVESMQEQIDLVADPASGYSWAQGTMSGGSATTPPRWEPVVGGQTIRAALNSEIKKADPGGDPQIMYLLAGDGKTTMPVLVGSVPVFAEATDPLTGKLVEQVDPLTPVAWIRQITQNGQQVIRYDFVADDGVMRHGTKSPWDDALPLTIKDGRATLDVTSRIPPDDTDIRGGAIGTTGWAITGKVAGATQDPFMPGLPAGSVIGSAGKHVMDAAKVVFGSDPEHHYSGPDPSTDIVSLALSGLMGPDVPDGRATLAILAKDPTFQNQIDTETRVASGQKLENGAWTGGSEFQYKGFAMQAYIVMGGQDIATVPSLWKKTDTATTTPTDKRYQANFADNLSGKLASDLLKGTPFEHLGNAFVDGTNQIKQPPHDVLQAPYHPIDSGFAIKLPSVGPGPGVSALGLGSGAPVQGGFGKFSPSGYDQSPVPGVSTEQAPAYTVPGISTDKSRILPTTTRPRAW